MIAIIIGTFAGTVIALVAWEFWRECTKQKKSRFGRQPTPPPSTLGGLAPGDVTKLKNMTPAERENYVKTGRKP